MSAPRISSTSDADEDAGTTAVYRTVSESFRSRPGAEVDVIGWSPFLGIVILLPSLPILLLVGAVTNALDAVAPTAE
ncbi:hypothetical protein ACFR97_10475 [Haloplanus litoreus]|uniref:Uncharacterized protein n=1 Tax=Haloplanus litoreus TaxID=767515 RepID=A0ABD6A3A3_9EURY